jgi:hypothetical protein
MRVFALRPAGLLVFAMLLTACTITFEPWVEVRPTVPPRPSPRIEAFEPDRGAGAAYRIGEPIGFRILTNADGYVTLSALDADGEVYVFARNIRVRANRTQVISGIGPRQQFVVDPPTGRHYVRASFTPDRTDERVVYVGVRGRDAWLRRITLELRLFDVFDQRETTFTVVRR